MGIGALDQTTALERLTAFAAAAIASWIGINWLLALTHTFTRGALFAALAVFLIAAAVVLVRGLQWPRPGIVTIAACIPIALWIAYVLWRGIVLPPDNHDALAYHLPKAVLMIDAHGYGRFLTGDPRVAVLPANYELLLADVLLLTGTDHITEWWGTLFYGLFLLATGAAIQRWFGSGLHVAASVLAAAACPVLLLHSGADKNDLMTCFFAVCALMWGARWSVHGGTMPWILTIISLAAAGGTKPHAAAVLLGLAPFLAAGAMRKGVPLRLTIVTATIAFGLGGGAVYAYDLVHRISGTTPNFAGYGDWANWWRFPYMALAEPFSRDPSAVWVPWSGEWWFWPRYEIFFSGFGPLFTILVCLTPYCLYRFRDRVPERFVFCIAAAVAAFAIMPLQFRPLGFFGGLPRFMAFIVPAVIGCSLAPIVRRYPSPWLVAALAVYFMWQAVLCAVNDRFSPFGYARWAAAHPGTRVVWFNPWRAGSVVDRLAGPQDTVAVDGGFDTWIYPAMGERHSRRIEFIAPGAAVVPPEAQWVMVDKSWNAIWSGVTDLGHVRGAIEHGAADTEDTRVIRALRKDRRFRLVYYDPRHNQAVFRRVE